MEYLCNCAWWMGRVSEIDGQRAAVSSPKFLTPLSVSIFETAKTSS